MSIEAHALGVGELTERVAWLAYVETRNAYGEVIQDWESPSVYRWAKIEALDSSEAILAERPRTVTRYQVTMRYEYGYGANLRLYWKNKNTTLEVVGWPRITPDNFWMIFECTECLD